MLVTEKQNKLWRHMRVRTVVPRLYSRFHPNPFRFGGVITETPSATPKKFFEPITVSKVMRQQTVSLLRDAPTA